MERSDGYEVCEQIGIYLLHKLSKIMNKNDRDHCRDDDLINVRNCNRKNIQTRKIFVNILKMWDST